MTLRSIALTTIALASGSFAQSTSDCGGGIPLCGGIYTEAAAPPGTGATYEFTGTCNAGLETSSLWYTFVVEEAGTISFVLDPADDADDYDWGMFNITNGGCAGIAAQDGTSPEVSCNSYGETFFNGPTGISTANGGTGSSNGPGNLNGPAFNGDLQVEAGQTYALVVMNWSNSPNGYTIDFTGSTASIFDSTIPSVEEAVADCENLNLHVEFSEPMVTATVALTDFALFNAGGDEIPLATLVGDQPGSYAQTGYNIGLASAIQEPGLYTLHITSVSANVEDVCGNIVVDTTLSVTIAEPLRYELVVHPACNASNGAIELDHISGGVEPLTFTVDGEAGIDGIVAGLSLGAHTVTIADAGGCLIVRQVNMPNHAINAQIPSSQDSLSCATPTVNIRGVSVQPFQTVTYAWAQLVAGDTIQGVSTSATPEVSTPGTYLLIVTEPLSGCTDNASVTISATQTPTVDFGEIVLPNVISPNADGKNDIWRPFLQNDPEFDITGLFDAYDLEIFDRWGQVIHSSESSRSWNARDVADGSYFYRIAFRAECGTVIEGERTGTITVLR